MLKAIRSMYQEPWCFDPEIVARLTDFQILDAYLKEATERAEELRKQTQPDAPLGLPSSEKIAEAKASADGAGEFDMSQPPPRQAIISMYMGCGLSEKVAVQQYEKQLAAWRESKGVPGSAEAVN